MVNHPPLKSRRSSFRVWRWLGLFVTLLVAIWLGCHAKSARHQRLVVEEIRSLGGYVMYDYEARNDQIGKPLSPPGPQWLRDIVGDDWFQSAYYVRLEGAAVTDSSLPRLEQLPYLRGLEIRSTSVTDVSFVAQLHELVALKLSHSPITDEGLRALPGLQKLRSLDVSGTRITDEGLAYVGKIENLEVLKANGTAITNAGLRHLQNLKKPHVFEAAGTGVTDEAINEVVQRK